MRSRKEPGSDTGAGFLQREAGSMKSDRVIFLLSQFQVAQPDGREPVCFPEGDEQVPGFHTEITESSPQQLQAFLQRSFVCKQSETNGRVLQPSSCRCETIHCIIFRGPFGHSSNRILFNQCPQIGRASCRERV